MGPERCVWPQAVTRTVTICSENQGPVSQRVPTKAIADRAFGLQNDCRRHRVRDPRQEVRDTFRVPRLMVVRQVSCCCGAFGWSRGRSWPDATASALPPVTSTGMLRPDETCEHFRGYSGGVGRTIESARIRPTAEPPVRIPRATLGVRAAMDAAPRTVRRSA